MFCDVLKVVWSAKLFLSDLRVALARLMMKSLKNKEKFHSSQSGKFKCNSSRRTGTEGTFI